MSYPLAGVTVLDLTQIYNGPYATFLLAQAGRERRGRGLGAERVALAGLAMRRRDQRRGAREVERVLWQPDRDVHDVFSGTMYT